MTQIIKSRELTVTKIALTGKARAGKDEVAYWLWLRYRFERFAFGKALKRYAHEVFPWITADPKPRKLYQDFGQIMREHFDSDVWIRHVERDIERELKFAAGLHVRDSYGVVITDLRQPNEYEWARKNGFTIVRVTATDEVRVERARQAGDTFSEADLTHDTELHTDGFAVDYELVNDGSLAELRAEVDELMVELGAVK